MAVWLNPANFTPILEGTLTTRATAALPATATGHIFTVAGGLVAITGLVGVVTTVVQNQACTLAVQFTPTSGTAVVVATATSIQAAEAGSVFTLPQVAKSALVVNTAGGGGQLLGGNAYVTQTGTIDITTSATNTGSVKWYLSWFPIDSAATVTAA